MHNGENVTPKMQKLLRVTV